MRRWLLVLVACGANPAPPAVIGHRASAPAAPSCADVGVILRGPIEHGDNAADAGRAREAAIANACETDSWSAQVIACVASKAKPSECLDRLTPEQHGSYDEKLTAWAEQYGGESYGGDSYGGDDAAPEIECADAVKALQGPELDPAGDPAWGAAMRKYVLVEQCERDAWDMTARNCVQGAGDLHGTSACIAALDPDARDHVTARLTEVDRITVKLAAARKQPKQITCDKIVAGHYADARWKDKVDWVKGKDRTKMIAESRDRMKKACAADKWSDTLRACISLGGEDACFAAAGAPQKQWGFPARGVLVSTGVAECDAWGQAVMRLATCDKLPQTSRDALQQAYEQLQQTWAVMPPDQRATLAEACKQATDAVRQLASSCP
jgi:hypothetical protein